jgi:hypothetical protein
VFNDTTTRRHYSIPIHTDHTSWTYDYSIWSVFNSTANVTLADNSVENLTITNTGSLVDSYFVKLQVNNTYGGNDTTKSNYFRLNPPTGGGAAPVASLPQRLRQESGIHPVP